MIAGRARSIQRKAKDPEAVEKNAGIVAEQTARITRIIQRLLDFTRRKVGPNERALVNLNELSLIDDGAARRPVLGREGQDAARARRGAATRGRAMPIACSR